jgi:RHS repeat-associated protein
LVWYEGAGTTDKRWLIPDERGSIIAVTNASGAVTNVNRYDDYGVPASTNAGRFQYTGQAWLPELQMYYYKARIYAPALGRFLQTDPTGYDDGPNWYDYVGGDPVNKTDPTGLESGDVSYRSALSLAEGARSNPPPPEAVTAAMYAPLSGPIIRAFVAVFGPSSQTGPIVPKGPAFNPRASKTEVHHVVPHSDRRAAEARDNMRANGINPRTETTNRVVISGDRHDMTKRDSYVQDTNARIANQPDANSIKQECCKIAGNLRNMSVDELNRRYPAK